MDVSGWKHRVIKEAKIVSNTTIRYRWLKRVAEDEFCISVSDPRRDMRRLPERVSPAVVQGLQPAFSDMRVGETRKLLHNW